MFHPDPKSALRPKRLIAGAAAVALLATGLFGFNQMQSAEAAPTTTAGCRTTSAELVTDPNNANQKWLERHCDVTRGIAVYTDSPNAKTFPSPLAAIGYIAAGDQPFYCQTHSDHAAVDGNKWWALTTATTIIDQASADIVHGLGWVPVSVLAQGAKGKDASVPGIANCGVPAELSSIVLNGGVNQTGQTTPVGSTGTPAVVPATPAVVPATPVGNPNTGPGTPAGPSEPGTPMRHPTAPRNCPMTGTTETREGTAFDVVTCTTLYGAPVTSYVSSAAGAQIRTLSPGSHKFVCQSWGPANPTSINPSDKTVNTNNWWLLTAKADGPQGWVPATFIAQGGDGERVLPVEYDCPSSYHPAA